MSQFVLRTEGQIKLHDVCFSLHITADIWTEADKASLPLIHTLEDKHAYFSFFVIFKLISINKIL